MIKYLAIFFVSMVPLVELRLAMPIAMSMDLPYIPALVVCVLGNMIPVPFILLMIRQVLAWMEKMPIKFVQSFAAWLRRKAEKNTDKIQRFGFWGLCFFIAIPLPVTGAWTGSLVAATVHMKFWRAMLSALLGVMIAGVIVSLICLGVASGVEWLSVLI